MRIDALKNGKKLELTAFLPREGGEAIFEFESFRNYTISKQSDVSPLNPKAAEDIKNYPYTVEMWFPVVDIRIKPGMYAEARIENYDGVCFFNSFAWRTPYELKDGRITIAGEHLVDWENGLFTKTRDASLTKFSVFKKVQVLPAISRKAHCTVQLLSDDWSGRITVHYQIDGRWEELPAIEVKGDSLSKAPAPVFGTNSMVESLNESIGFILNTINTSPASPHNGGFFLFYDLDGRTYRQGQWPWGWGPAIKLLMEAGNIPEVDRYHSGQKLMEAGYQAGKASLRFQAYNPGHITDGLGTTRYSPRQYDKTGFQELVSSGSDAGFLCGWGWMSIYNATGDTAFLDAAKNFARSVKNVLSNFDLPPQDWLTASGDWIDFTIDESGFGTEGLAELYAATRDEQYAKLCSEYMDRHTKYFEREDGLWNRQYNWQTNKTTETFYNTRGMGWAFEGLLAAHRADPQGGKYLNKAVRMADVFLKYQHENGCWSYNFTQDIKDVGISEKGTALYSLLYYMLYNETSDPKYLAAARKALKWCMDNQYFGSDKHAYGGIIACSPASCVTYRQFYRACCNYTSGFLGLAILEELKH